MVYTSKKTGAYQVCCRFTSSYSAMNNRYLFLLTEIMHDSCQSKEMKKQCVYSPINRASRHKGVIMGPRQTHVTFRYSVTKCYSYIVTPEKIKISSGSLRVYCRRSSESVDETVSPGGDIKRITTYTEKIVCSVRGGKSEMNATGSRDLSILERQAGIPEM